MLVLISESGTSLNLLVSKDMMNITSHRKIGQYILRTTHLPDVHRHLLRKECPSLMHEKDHRGTSHIREADQGKLQ